MFRRVAVAAIVVLASLGSGGAAHGAECWHPPVDGVVTDPFRAPACPYCAGQRGIEYRVAANASVRAVAAGTVSWAGTVAGTRYVVVRHANGWRATYGMLTSSSLQAGDTVVRRARIGSAHGSFYFGLRVGEEYRDPAPYLGRLVGRPRLVPIDARPARLPPPPRLRCTSVAGGGGPGRAR